MILVLHIFDSAWALGKWGFRAMIDDEETQYLNPLADDHDGPYNARRAYADREEQAYVQSLFQRPALATNDELRRERFVKYGVALVTVATIVTVLDAISGLF